MSGASDILRERAEHPFDAGMAAEWPPMPDPRISDDAYYRRLSAAYSHRLRTTADALRDALDDFVRVPYGASHEDVAYIRDFEQRARAILARLDQEGPA